LVVTSFGDTFLSLSLSDLHLLFFAPSTQLIVLEEAVSYPGEGRDKGSAREKGEQE
jgi:hypothetical protein